MSNLFEVAARNKFRFSTSRGLVTVEDLWDLPLTSTTGKANLDDVARAIHANLQSSDNVSFVNTAQVKDETEQLKMDIVKHVISVKLAENAAASQARETREKKQRIMEVMERKKDEALSNASLEDLQKMLEAL